MPLGGGGRRCNGIYFARVINGPAVGRRGARIHPTRAGGAAAASDVPLRPKFGLRARETPRPQGRQYLRPIGAVRTPREVSRRKEARSSTVLDRCGRDAAPFHSAVTFIFHPSWPTGPGGPVAPIEKN